MSRLPCIGLIFILLFILGACTVADEPYPPRWDPLPPPLAADCHHFAGSYADRGEAPGSASPPSLTRELFGTRSPWEKASSVRVALETGGDVDITVSTSDGKPYARKFSSKTGEVTCDRGRMLLRSRRWVYSDVMSGRETVNLELHLASGYLVAQVNESLTGVMFMVVPLSGESMRWYRFPRLDP